MGKSMLRKIAPMMAVFAGLLWGALGYFVRELTAMGVSNMTIVACRMGGAMVMMAIFLWFYDKELLKINIKDIWLFIGSGAVGMVLLNFFYNAATRLTSLSLATLLLGTDPLFVIILASMLFKEKITKRKIISFLLVTLGCLFASGIIEGGTQFSVLGILAGIVSGFFYAQYSIFSRLAIKKGYRQFTIVFYSFIFATICASIFSDFGTVVTLINESPLQMGIFLVLHSLIVAVLPYTLLTLSLEYIEAGRASILAVGEPILATVIGAVSYGEHPNFLTLIGIGIVLFALAYLVQPEKGVSSFS